MQYNGYEIQITEDGYIVRDSQGKLMAFCADEPDAKEFIDDLKENHTDVRETTIDWYERFSNYCKRLPGRCYPTEDKRKFGTIFENPLKNLIRSFEDATQTTVYYKSMVIEGEIYYIVESVEKN